MEHIEKEIPLETTVEQIERIRTRLWELKGILDKSQDVLNRRAPPPQPQQ